MEGELESPGLKKELKEMELEGMLYELESLRMKMEIKRKKGELEFPGLEKELKEMKFERILYEVESLRLKVEIRRKKGELELEENVEYKVESLMKENREKIELKTPVSGVIVLGGRDQDGQSLTSVEGFIFYEGRWIELPPMNIPRSFAASTLVDNEIIVSGGDTGDTLTDTIETLNLDETPLQWIISDATLPVPLSGHKTVVHQGKLITIGGHDGNEGRNSDKIYEVPLTPPFTPRVLTSLPQPRAWHGAELVNDKIFVFGGGRNPGVPNDEVVVYDLSSNQCNVMSQLPYRVQGMATVCLEKKVFLLGGVDETQEELDHVITYDTVLAETRRLPSMKLRRGGCCAVICPIVESSGGCSSNTPTDTLVALGNLLQLNAVERFNFHSHAWSDMPSTKEARNFCTAVVCHVDFNIPE